MDFLMYTFDMNVPTCRGKKVLKFANLQDECASKI